MPLVEKSLEVQVPIGRAEERWQEFLAEQGSGAAAPSSASQTSGQPMAGAGAVYFNPVDDGTTEVTIQVSSDDLSADAEAVEERIGTYLDRFRDYLERQ